MVTQQKKLQNELKAQRDLIAEQDKNGVYVARSKKLMVAGTYCKMITIMLETIIRLINLSFSSYETDIKICVKYGKSKKLLIFKLNGIKI